MNCKVCGRNIEREGANFCDYCGTSFRAEAEPVEIQKRTVDQAIVRNGSEGANGAVEKEISFKNWLGTLMLPLIPIAGSVIYIVMMFVWAFSSSAPKSKRNWARANLIVTAISFILLIYLVVNMLSGGIPDYSNMFS